MLRFSSLSSTVAGKLGDIRFEGLEFRISSILMFVAITSCSHGERIEELEKKFNASEERTEAMADAINKNFKLLEKRQDRVVDHVSRICFEEFEHYIKMYPCSKDQLREQKNVWRKGI